MGELKSAWKLGFWRIWVFMDWALKDITPSNGKVKGNGNWMFIVTATSITRTL